MNIVLVCLCSLAQTDSWTSASSFFLVCFGGEMLVCHQVPLRHSSRYLSWNYSLPRFLSFSLLRLRLCELCPTKALFGLRVSF